MFNKLAEIAGEYCKKGGQVYIEGSIRTDKYQDKKTGEDRYSTSIIANNMQLLGSRGDSGGGGGGDFQPKQRPQSTSAPAQQAHGCSRRR